MTACEKASNLCEHLRAVKSTDRAKKLSPQWILLIFQELLRDMT